MKDWAITFWRSLKAIMEGEARQRESGRSCSPHGEAFGDSVIDTRPILGKYLPETQLQDTFNENRAGMQDGTS